MSDELKGLERFVPDHLKRVEIPASAPAGPPIQPETLASLRAELETLRSVIRWELETIAAQPSDRILPGFHFRAWVAELRRRAGMENET